MRTVKEYFREVEKKLYSPFIASYEIKYDEKSESVGILSGTLIFSHGYILEFLELME